VRVLAGRRPRAVGVLLIALAGLLAATSISSASVNVNISGKWDSVFHDGSANYPDVLTITQATGSDTITGTDEIQGTLSGTLSNGPSNSVVLTMTETDGSYTADFTVTITVVGGKPQSWSGTLTDSNGLSGTDTATIEGPPVLGQSGQASVVSGTVTIETPGATTFSSLSGSSSIPMGSTINATNGTVAITVATPAAKTAGAAAAPATQSGDFYDGEFLLTQSRSGVTKETLEGGSFSACPAAGTRRLASAATAAKGTPVRQLWGHAHGSFSTSGRGGAATVLGTIWQTVDYCNGTLFKAVKDSITVVTFAQPHTKHLIAQGHSFFAAVSGS
jgi:hypothetical protein